MRENEAVATRITKHRPILHAINALFRSFERVASEPSASKVMRAKRGRACSLTGMFHDFLCAVNHLRHLSLVGFGFFEVFCGASPCARQLSYQLSGQRMLMSDICPTSPTFKYKMSQKMKTCTESCLHLVRRSTSHSLPFVTFGLPHLSDSSCVHCRSHFHNLQHQSKPLAVPPQEST